MHTYVHTYVHTVGPCMCTSVHKRSRLRPLTGAPHPLTSLNLSSLSGEAAVYPLHGLSSRSMGPAGSSSRYELSMAGAPWWPSLAATPLLLLEKCAKGKESMQERNDAATARAWMGGRMLILTVIGREWYSHKPNTYVRLVLCIVATIRIKVSTSIRITYYHTDMHRKSTW